MQFPVPQFTDVEDRIIGPLTIKQFGIVFAAGVVIFMSYSASKNLLFSAFVFMLVGMPALAVAFAKINGRPLYNTFGYVFKYATSPKLMVFHKEASSFGSTGRFKDAQTSSAPPAEPVQPSGSPRARLQEVRVLLEKKAQEEKDLAAKYKESNI